MARTLTLDISQLTNSAIGNFICSLPGPSRDEAIGLLLDLQGRIWKYVAGQVSGSPAQVLGLKPLKGVPHHFEKRGPTLRIYVKYDAGQLTIVNGGPKTTQDADIERLKKGLTGQRRGRRRPR